MSVTIGEYVINSLKPDIYISLYFRFKIYVNDLFAMIKKN